MNARVVAGRCMDGLHVDTPVVVAAERAINDRFRAMTRRIRDLSSSESDASDRIRQLRVATRRAATALFAFGEVCDRPTVRAARRAMRRLRWAAGGARNADVLIQRLLEDPRVADSLPTDVRGRLQEALATARRKARAELLDALRRCDGDRIDGWRRQLLRSLRRARRPRGQPEDSARDIQPYSLGELGAVELPALLANVRVLGSGDVMSASDLHRLRIANKKLRYAFELFAGCFPSRYRARIQHGLEQTQDRLGAMNDVFEIVVALRGDLAFSVAPAADHGGCAHGARSTLAGFGAREDGTPTPRVDASSVTMELATALTALRAQTEAEYDRSADEFRTWWREPSTASTYATLDELIQSHCVDWTHAVRSRRHPGLAGPKRAVAPTNPSTPQEPIGWLPRHRRIAAIDVGTNSIRLTVAETDPESGFRIIEDIKETTRLGSGVFTEGRLQPAAMERSIAALETMRHVAEGHHADRIRAIGTSALREARNTTEFLDAVRRRAGVYIDVIDAKQEARLAFSSVANAFDLTGRKIAVADIGGGSTELVLGADGVVDAVYPLPLGAVRMTERFPSGDDPEGAYGRMVRAIDAAIDDNVASLPFSPSLLIGTGGTFTSLARVAILEGTPGASSGQFPFAVRGYELSLSDVTRVLTRLRRMTPESRRNVAGLSTQRSEVIVAGACILERVMMRLAVSRIRVHDGGIRDGLLSEMVDDLLPNLRRARVRRFDVVQLARSFAERCEFERPHAEHVAALALQIFDQLAEQIADASGTWARPECRALLHAAAILHDVGMLISWRSHHRHGYDMVMHGDFPGLSRREIEILASAARYHRKSGPRARHVRFRKLRDDDQRLVRHLVGILRVADGLDRLHIQNVRAVRVDVDDGRVRFEAEAERFPAAGLSVARRKADVFESAFRVETEFAWSPTGVKPSREHTQP